MEAQRSHRLACRHSANKWWRVDLPPDVPSVRDGLGAPLRSLHLDGAPSPTCPESFLLRGSQCVPFS